MAQLKINIDAINEVYAKRELEIIFQDCLDYYDPALIQNLKDEILANKDISSHFADTYALIIQDAPGFDWFFDSFCNEMISGTKRSVICRTAHNSFREEAVMRFMNSPFFEGVSDELILELASNFTKCPNAFKLAITMNGNMHAQAHDGTNVVGLILARAAVDCDAAIDAIRFMVDHGYDDANALTTLDQLGLTI